VRVAPDDQNRHGESWGPDLGTFLDEQIARIDAGRHRRLDDTDEPPLSAAEREDRLMVYLAALNRMEVVILLSETERRLGGTEEEWHALREPSTPRLVAYACMAALARVRNLLLPGTDPLFRRIQDVILRVRTLQALQALLKDVLTEMDGKDGPYACREAS
jgi:hypothetical protein